MILGRENSEISDNMTKSAETEQVKSKTNAQVDLEAWLTKSAATAACQWLMKNQSTSLREHTAFAAVSSNTYGHLCTCNSGGEVSERCRVHGNPSLALADLVWFISDAIYEHVPACVPSVPMAFNLSLQDASARAGEGAPDGADIPQHLRYLCKKIDPQAANAANAANAVPGDDAKADDFHSMTS